MHTIKIHEVPYRNKLINVNTQKRILNHMCAHMLGVDKLYYIVLCYLIV